MEKYILTGSYLIAYIYLHFAWKIGRDIILKKEETDTWKLWALLLIPMIMTLILANLK